MMHTHVADQGCMCLETTISRRVAELVVVPKLNLYRTKIRGHELRWSVISNGEFRAVNLSRDAF
jgi:hypothetical protein